MLATNNPKSMQRIKKTQFEPIPLLLDHIEANKLWRTIKIPKYYISIISRICEYTINSI